MIDAKKGKLFNVVFCVLLENDKDHSGIDWARQCASKISGSVATEFVYPESDFAIKEKIKQLIPQCDRIVFAAKTYPVGSDRHQLISRIKTAFPKMESISMTYF
jgi:hypothetical protein